MKFQGIIPALITPLKTDESINTEVLHRLVHFLLDQGADGLYVGGATGEGLALKTEERMVLAQEAVLAAGGRKPCIIQVAAADYQDAILLAKHAESVGADAISATPPLFFSYDEDDVYNYYRGLAESVHIPLMIYYNPAAGFHINAEFAARMFEVDNITAIKWTSSDYYGMLRLKDLTHGEMNVINGPDEMLLMGLNAGADGGIGSTYNIQLPTIKAIWNAFCTGDIAAAQQAQTRADRVIFQLLRYKIIPALKVVLEDWGFAVGNAAFPMKRYSAEEKQAILNALRDAGLQR